LVLSFAAAFPGGKTNVPSKWGIASGAGKNRLLVKIFCRKMRRPDKKQAEILFWGWTANVQAGGVGLVA